MSDILKTGFLSLIILAFMACKGQRMALPQSGGRPYEVLIVGDTSHIIQNLLTKNMPGLPQLEPMFDVSSTGNSQLNATTQLTRAIVIVSVDKKKYAHTKVRYDYNVFASPQIILYVYTPSAIALKRFLKKNGEKIIDLLVNEEMKTEISSLKLHHNAQAESVIKKQFGIDILVPSTLVASKQGDNFVWLSESGTSGASNLCVYITPQGSFLHTRDSVMKNNIPGEQRNMYMQTVGNSITRQQLLAPNDTNTHSTSFLSTGLWEMKNDAMGGPFVARTLSFGNKTLTIEGFVYAPGQKKKNKLRQLEAVLYTLTTKQFEKNGK